MAGGGGNPMNLARLALSEFTSQWFLLPLGTVVISVILHQLDYQFRGLRIISYMFWVLAIVMLLTFFILYLLRLAVFPRKTARIIATDMTELSCLSSVVISFTSIVQMMTLSVVSTWGHSWGVAAYALWWLNALLALLATGATYLILTVVRPSGIPELMPSSRLPLIAVITTAAAGGTISVFGELSVELQVPQIIVSYLLLGLGVALAFMFDVLFWARIVNRSSLAKGQIYQEMILCGPWGQSSFALQGLGEAVRNGSFAQYDSGVFITAQAAGPISAISTLLGLFAWGFGTYWWLHAISSILYNTFDHGKLRGLPVGLGIWCLIFPWGVYTNAAVELGKLLDAKTFKIWSAALAVMLVVLWLFNMALTIKGIINGTFILGGRKWKDALTEDSNEGVHTSKRSNGGSGIEAGLPV